MSNIVVFGQGECFRVHLKLPSTELFYLCLCFIVLYCYFCICRIISEMKLTVLILLISGN